MRHAHDLADDLVNVYAFTDLDIDVLIQNWPERPSTYTLTRHFLFKEFYVLGKYWMLKEPLYTLQPHLTLSPNEAGAISFALMKRWKENPTRLLACYRASRECHGIYGGKRRRLGPFAAHHLGVSAVYTALKVAGKAEGWELEDSRFVPPGLKRPDAFHGDTLIDFGGCYSTRRIRELGAIACDWGRPLEIW